MSKIITVAHQKGGVGKSTLVLNLAHCFKAGGLNVLIVDMDLQGSLLGLAGMEDIQISPPPENINTIQSLPFDIIIIDTPPYLSNTLPGLFQVSDFILIQTKTGFFDVMAIKSTISLVKEAKTKKPSLISGIVLNMVKNRTSLTDEVKEIIGSYNEGVMNTMIFERVAYIRSALTAGVLTSDDNKAKEEITALASEIIETISI